MDGSWVQRGARGAYLALKSGYGPTVSQSITELRRFVENEVSSWEKGWLSMPLRRRLWLWRRGFLSQADVFYDVHEDNYREYLSGYQRERAAWINGPQKRALDDKLFFHWMMEPFETERVSTYGLLKNGRFHDLRSLRPSGGTEATNAAVSVPSDDHRGTVDADDWVLDRLQSEGALVVKPRRGGGGKNVMLCSFEDGSYAVNGETYEPAAFASFVRGLDGYLVSQAVEQARYADDLFADATNTLRVLTVYDDAADEPYLPVAAHRVGTARSAPVDNFSNGGLAAKLDRETGQLSAAFQYPYAGDLEWHDTHPDTGARIEDTEVPDWEAVSERLLDIAATFSHTPYLGWDVVLTGEGEFTVIEANNSINPRFFQVHGPLLDDARLRGFYERHGVIPSSE